MTFSIIENGEHVVDPTAFGNFSDHFITSNMDYLKSTKMRQHYSESTTMLYATKAFDKDLEKYKAHVKYSNKSRPSLHRIEKIYFDTREDWLDFWMMWS